MSIFSDVNYKELLEKLDLEDKILHNLLDKHFRESNSRSENIELCNMGSFLISLDLKAEIIKHQDAPDFIVKVDGKIVGIENSRLLHPEKSKYWGSVRNITDLAEQIYKRRYPNEVGFLADIVFFNDYISCRKSENIKYAEEIFNFIYCLVNHIPCDSPDYIYYAKIKKHPRIYFYANSSLDTSDVLTEKHLNQLIEKKETKLSGYQNNIKVEEYWLLLIAGSLEPDSYEVTQPTYEIKETPFNHVFLLQDFGNNSIKLK